LLEFVGDDGEARGAEALEQGEKVRVVMSTEAGLWRYDLEDVVEVVGRCRRTPLVRFVGKAGRWLNVLGERVSGEQVSHAMASVARDGTPPVGFTVGVTTGEQPRYRIAVEGIPADEGLSRSFDTALKALNMEYAGKRASGRLGPPAVHSLADGRYARYRESRTSAGAAEGQVKDPILAIDDAEWAAVVDG
jgi:hypothetical protein